MLAIVTLVRRTVEGSLSAILLIALVAALGASETINLLIAERSAASILFLLMMAVVLADLIAKLISVVSATFPDLLPKLDEDDLKRASLISRLRPGQTVALLSGANAARVVMFVVIFAALGASYAGAPREVQQTLFGAFEPMAAIEAFIREGIAGSVGYFLFFLGGDKLEPITSAIASERLRSSSVDCDIFLSGIRLYGLAFALAILRTLATPIIYVRARLRARNLAGGETSSEPAADSAV